MALQRIFTNYRASVDSFPLGEQNIGLIKPGRFNGFDQMVSRGALNIRITHSGQIRKTNISGQADNKFGAIVMPTGNIIHEMGDIDLTVSEVIEPGDLQAVFRNDIVVCEHNYAQVQGGTLANYFIIQGAPNGTIPLLPDPRKQVIVGVITKTMTGNTFADLTWTPAPAPLPGDMDSDTLFEYIREQINTEGGEKNTASNMGAVGAGVFAEKQGVNLNFRKLKSENNSLNISEGEEAINIEVRDTFLATHIEGNNNQENVSGSIELTHEHIGKTVYLNPLGGTVQVLVKRNLPSNFNVAIVQDGPGTVELVAAPDTTINYPLNQGLKIRGNNCSIYLEHRSNDLNKFNVFGDLKA